MNVFNFWSLFFGCYLRGHFLLDKGIHNSNPPLALEETGGVDGDLAADLLEQLLHGRL